MNSRRMVGNIIADEFDSGQLTSSLVVSLAVYCVVHYKNLKYYIHTIYIKAHHYVSTEIRIL